MTYVVSVLSPRANTNFTIASLGINGLNVGGPNGRPLRKDEQGFPVLNISGYMGLGDDQAVEQRRRTADHVDVPLRHGVVRAGTERGAPRDPCGLEFGVGVAHAAKR